MNIKYVMVGLSLVAQVAIADDVKQSLYGQNLDCAQIVSINAPQGCDVGEATMVYKDSHGQTHTLVYLRQGENCPG